MSVMAKISEESTLSLVRLAADYTNQTLPQDVRENVHVIAAKNASLFGKLLHHVEAYMRCPDSSVITLRENLATLQFPDRCIEGSISILEEVKKQTQKEPNVRQSHTPSLAGIQWRVDITISSSMLSRVLEPNLIMEWQLSNGQRVMFEVSVANFHKLRYTVASILRDMNLMRTKLNSIKS